MKQNKYIYILLHHSRTGGESFTKFVEENLPSDETFRVDSCELNKTPLSKRKKLRFLAGHTTYFGMHELIPNRKPRYISVIRDPAKVKASMYHSRMMDFPENKKQSFEKWCSLRKKNEMMLFFDEKYRCTNKKVVLSHKIKRKLRENILDKLDKTKTIHTFLKKLRRKQKSPSIEKEKFQNAKKLLDECWFICLTENLKEGLELLFKDMGVKPDWSKYKIKSRIHGELSILNKGIKQKIYRENPLDLELYEYALKLNKEKKKKITGSA